VKWILIATLLAQADSPEAAFRKVEESITKAKGLSVTLTFYRTSKESGGKIMEGSSRLLMKPTHKISWITQIANPPMNVRLLCDGTIIRIKMGEQLLPDQKVPRESGGQDEFALYIARMGCFPGARATAAGKGDPEESEKFQVSGVSWGEREPAVESLKYTLNVNKEAFLVKLWFDPKTLDLKKRTVILPGGDTLTEIYQEWVTTADIPDDKFKLDSK
jgi:outer membrane lipoprotein-sorting protein